MKAIQFIKPFCITAVFAAGLFACKKEMKTFLPAQTDFSGKSFIKVYNSVINSTRNFVYINTIPVTGAALAYGSLFPSVSYYSVIDAGNRDVLIKDTLITTTQKPISFAAPFDEGVNYTIFTYDTLTNTKYLVTKDNIQQPVDTTSRLRFANLVYSKTAVPNVDIYSIKRKENIFTNVPVASVTDFIPFSSGIADTLYVRATGTTTNLTQLNGINNTQKRSYTIVFRGIYATTTGTLARSLISFNTF
jgi:Domain of unknown function (DUF4397)